MNSIDNNATDSLAFAQSRYNLRSLASVTDELKTTRSRYMEDGDFPREYDGTRFETEHEMLARLTELEQEYRKTTDVVHCIGHQLLIAQLRLSSNKTSYDYSGAKIFPVKYASRQELIQAMRRMVDVLKVLGSEQSALYTHTPCKCCKWQCP